MMIRKFWKINKPYKAIRKALFIKQGQGCECMQKDRQEGLKLLHQIQRILSYTY